jgi:hypothetical protein
MDEGGKDSGKTFVGVLKNENGSLDFSSTAQMGKELKISDPIVDKLRGPLVIDEDKEDSYKTFQEEMIKKSEAGEMNTWLIDTLNGLRREGSSDITQDDIASLKFVSDAAEIQDIRKQYGYEFARPYFQLSLGDYKKVYEKLTGRLDSNGCLLNGGKLDNNLLTQKIGITLAPGLGPDILHELGHTIDPNIDKRSSSDKVLEEFSTFYREAFVPRVYISSTKSKNKDGTYTEPVISQHEVYQNPKKIGATLKSDIYSEKYAGAFKSDEAYQDRVNHIVEVVEQLERYMDKNDINKAIYNAKSFYELSHLLDVVKRENT